MTNTLKKQIIKKSDKITAEALIDSKDRIKNVMISNKSKVTNNHSVIIKNNEERTNQIININ